MKKMIKREPVEGQLTMTMDDFVASIGAGYHTANMIANDAEAKIYIGRRILINLDKVKKYLDEVSG